MGAGWFLLTPSVSPALPAAQGHSGWNKVALLTAVRNSPCFCPFSVSLHPPLAALNSEPRPGSLLAFCNHHPKAVPVYGESGTKCRKGNGLEMLTAASYPPLSFAYAQQNAGWNMVVLQRCRLQYSLFRPILPSLHRPLGALGSNPPHAVAPFGALYKLIHKQQRGRIASPYLHNLLCSPAARRISHCASNISLRISAISPVRKNGFHRGRKPPTSPFLPGQRSGSRRPPRCRW